MANVFSKFKIWFFQTLSFLKSEPLMAVCLAAIILIYGSMMLSHHKKPHDESKAMQQIEQAEKKLKEKDQAQVLQEFILKEAKPFQLFLLICVPVLIGALLISGIFIDSYFAGQIAQKKEVIIPISPGSEPAAWGIKEIIKSVIYVMFAGIVFSLLLGIAQGLLFRVKNENDNAFLVIHTVLVDIFILWFIIHTVTRTFGERLSALGLRTQKLGRDIWLGICAYAGALPILLIVLGSLVLITELLHIEPPPHPLVEIFVEEDYKNPALIYFSIFLACTLGPIIEEIFFRGFCYPAFKKKWGAGWAMVLSAGFFAAIHQSLFAFLPIFVLGLIFAYLYEKRGSLIPSIVMHILHNTIFIGYFFLLKRAVLDKLITS